MRTLRFLIAAIVLLMVSTVNADAQGILKKMGKAAERAAERTLESKTEQKTEEAVGKSVDKVTDPDTYKGNENNNQKQQPPQQQESVNAPANAGNTDPSTGVAASAGPALQQGQTLEMTYAKSDFVPGDEIIFEDDLAGEQMGEFPSQWDLLHGNAEVANYNGTKCIHFEVPTEAHIAPLMKNMKNYLPEVFTLEFDFWVNAGTELDQRYLLHFKDEDGNSIAELTFAYDNGENKGHMMWNYYTPSNEHRSGNFDQVAQKGDAFNHLSVSFNKRAFKVYVNGVRVVNVPNMKAPNNFTIRQYAWGGFKGNRNSIANIRLAQGAVPLYDRMMSDGKFITYGITFDVGKSTIKPESMGEINRIVQLMNETSDLKFSVEGHTDNTGNAALNQTLSEARSKAIVDKLVEMGVLSDRLTNAGKGQNSPIADNSTDEGRAKNRRVEFVKQ